MKASQNTYLIYVGNRHLLFYLLFIVQILKELTDFFLFITYRFVYSLLLLVIVLWLVLDTIKDLKRLRSVAGLFVFTLLAYLMSKHRKKVE